MTPPRPAPATLPPAASPPASARLPLAAWGKAAGVIAGLMALAWFLIRVLPKPSRAAYPCQRAAFPIASAFVLWAAGSLAGMFAVERLKPLLRRSGAGLAAFSVAALLGFSAWSMVLLSGRSDGASWPLAVWSSLVGATTYPANQPVGIARGINPGRVVWSRDPAAAHWSGSTTDGTHWWDAASTDQGRVDAMLSRGLQRLTSTASDPAAWDALFRSFNQRRGNGAIGYQQSAKQQIVIKINQNAANQSNNNNYTGNGCDNQNCIVANPHLIHALLGQLINQAQVPAANITIYDASGFNRGWGGPRTIGDGIYRYNHADFPGVVFMDGLGGGAAGEKRALAAWPGSDAIVYPRSFADESQAKGKQIVQQVLDAGFLINLAILKNHGDGPTLCAKNHYGSISGQRHGPIYGNDANDLNYYSNLVPLMGHQDLGEKTLLFLIDALYGSRTGPNDVPSKWTMAPFQSSWPASVLLSQDGVAIDAVGFDLLNAEIGLPANSDRYLYEAASIPDAQGRKMSGTVYQPNAGSTAILGSLGVHEHWDSATSRKYSRNLGLGNGIELSSLGATAVATPTCVPAGGTFATPQSATLACATAGATIYYTTDGSVPTDHGTVYTAPIAIAATTTITAVAMKDGSANSQVATATLTITVLAQTISFPAPAPQVYAGSALVLTLGATASSGLPVAYNVVSGPATVAGNLLTITAAGTVVVTATQGGNATYAAAAPVSQSLVVRTAQTISFAAPGAQTFGVAPLTLTASATSALPVAFSVVSGPAAVSGSLLTITGAGTVVVAADQAGNAVFAPAPRVTQTLVVAQAGQTIAFPEMAAQTWTGSDLALALQATASSGLAVSYRVISGPATVAGNLLTITATGTVVVAADQAGNGDYSAAPEVSRSLAVQDGTGGGGGGGGGGSKCGLGFGGAAWLLTMWMALALLAQWRQRRRRRAP